MNTRHDLAAALLTAAARLSAPAMRMCVTRLIDEKRTIYLTFDDGPHPETTQHLLDLLEEFESSATFFVTGENVRRHPALARRIVAAGHTIGQHTDTHVDAWRARPSTVLSEMETASTAIEDTTGDRVSWMRPPFGHLTPGIVRWARENGQRIALWDVMPGDFLASATSHGVAKNVEKMVRPGSLVVLHEDTRTARVTPAAVGRILEFGRASGIPCARL